MVDSDPLVASSVHRIPAQNSQRDGRSLPRQGRDHLIQWDVWISVGFFTETTGYLRNPETRRTPSYVLKVGREAREVGEIVPPPPIMPPGLSRLVNVGDKTFLVNQTPRVSIESIESIDCLIYIIINRLLDLYNNQ